MVDYRIFTGELLPVHDDLVLRSKGGSALSISCISSQNLDVTIPKNYRFALGSKDKLAVLRPDKRLIQADRPPKALGTIGWDFSTGYQLASK